MQHPAGGRAHVTGAEDTYLFKSSTHGRLLLLLAQGGLRGPSSRSCLRLANHTCAGRFASRGRPLVIASPSPTNRTAHGRPSSSERRGEAISVRLPARASC